MGRLFSRYEHRIVICNSIGNIYNQVFLWWRTSAVDCTSELVNRRKVKEKVTEDIFKIQGTWRHKVKFVLKLSRLNITRNGVILQCDFTY